MPILFDFSTLAGAHGTCLMPATEEQNMSTPRTCLSTHRNLNYWIAGTGPPLPNCQPLKLGSLLLLLPKAIHSASPTTCTLVGCFGKPVQPGNSSSYTATSFLEGGRTAAGRETFSWHTSTVFLVVSFEILAILGLKQTLRLLQPLLLTSCLLPFLWCRPCKYSLICLWHLHPNCSSQIICHDGGDKTQTGKCQVLHRASTTCHCLLESTRATTSRPCTPTNRQLNV